MSKPCSRPVGRSGREVGSRRARTAPRLRIGAPPADCLQRLADVHGGDSICFDGDRGAHVGRALEWYVAHLHARGALEHEHQQVVVGADAGGADRDLAGIGARVRCELLEVADRRVGVHREVARIVDDVAEQSKRCRAAELRGALDRDGHERRRVDEADGVAVGRRALAIAAKPTSPPAPARLTIPASRRRRGISRDRAPERAPRGRCRRPAGTRRSS